jgi:hypothetical protein
MQYQNFINLINKIIEIRYTVERSYGIKYESQDARMVFFDQLQVNILSKVIAMNAFIQLRKIINNDHEFCASIQSIVSANKAFDYYKKNQSNSFLCLTHFNLSNLFENIVRNNDQASYSKSFITNLDYLRKKLKLSDYYFKSLVAFNHLRNTLHNNGIHRGDKFSFTFSNGENLMFEKNKTFYFSENSIYFLIVEIVQSLEFMFMSNSIDWSNYIKDEFSHEFETDFN